MAFDAHKNLAISAVATAPTPATSGTSLVVTAGHGARFPAAPFNVTIWPATAPPDPLNAEVARVTARATDTLTIQRAQEGSTARLVGVGDLIAQTITAKTLTDLETQAALLDAANVFTQSQKIQQTGVDAKLSFIETSQPVNQRAWLMMNYAQDLYFQPANDAGAGLLTALAIKRNGAAYIGAGIYERGRVQPLGGYQPWATIGYTAAAAAIGGTVTGHFAVMGQTVFWRLICASYTVAAPSAYLYFGLPPGYGPITGDTGPALLRAYIPGATPPWQMVYAELNPANLLLYWPGGNFPAGGGSLSGQGFYFTNG